MKEALCFSETSVITITTERNTSEDTILDSHRCETSNLTGFKMVTFRTCYQADDT
jgi:hypothetical protein